MSRTMPMRTIKPTTTPMIKPVCDEFEEEAAAVGEAEAFPFPAEPELGVALAPDDEPSSGLEVSDGAAACSALSGSMMP